MCIKVTKTLKTAVPKQEWIEMCQTEHMQEGRIERNVSFVKMCEVHEPHTVTLSEGCKFQWHQVCVKAFLLWFCTLRVY